MAVIWFRYYFMFALCLVIAYGYGQSLEFKLYNKSVRQIEEKDYEGALKSIDRYCKYFSDSPRMASVFCNRALIHVEMKEGLAAIDDYVMALSFDSLNQDIYRMRANVYLQLNKKEAAMRDFDYALLIDSSMGECYAAKAKLLQEQNSNKSCYYYYLALKHGYKPALQSIAAWCDTNNVVVQRYQLKLLDIKSQDSDYGYSEYKPIKVGGNAIERLEQYLSLLRDKNGYPLKFNHINTCCPYKSTYGAFGKGLCDVYEVMMGEDRRILYLSLYDYDDARIPVGLYSNYHFRE